MTALLQAQAQLADPGARKSFSPTDNHRLLARALVSTKDHPKSFEELLTLSGVPPDWLHDFLANDPQGCDWIIAQASSFARLGLATVYSKMYENAVKSKSSTAAELFLKRFDPEFKKDQVIQENTQNNIFLSWTSQELEAFVRQKKQKVLGAPS